jgi:hypothetical protein
MLSTEFKTCAKNAICKINADEDQLTNPIRRFRASAIEQIPKASRPDIYAYLLIANYKEGDGELLTTLVDKTTNENKFHVLAYSFIAIYRANKTKDCKAPLLAIYDKINCGICRQDILKILVAAQVLPHRVRKEIQYDSYVETRKLYQNRNS